MSEPLSSVEIEDVLTSIRRLVSEDLRPASRAAAFVPAAEPAAAVARPALILTPALRVVSDVEPAREAVQVEAVEAPARAGVMPIEEVVASVGAAVTAQPQDWEPEQGDAVIGADPIVWADAVWDAPEGAVQETAPADVADPGWAQAGVDEVEMSEPVKEPTSDVAADPAWVEEAEAEVIAGLERGEASFGVSESEVESEAELSFDEEMLRDLVRDLIREELQGDLGERITRNIRKLVRAEIARALTAAELD